MTPVGFEPTQLAVVELESTPLDHSGKVSLIIANQQQLLTPNTYLLCRSTIDYSRLQVIPSCSQAHHKNLSTKTQYVNEGTTENFPNPETQRKIIVLYAVTLCCTLLHFPAPCNLLHFDVFPHPQVHSAPLRSTSIYFPSLFSTSLHSAPLRCNLCSTQLHSTARSPSSAHSATCSSSLKNLLLHSAALG